MKNYLSFCHLFLSFYSNAQTFTNNTTAAAGSWNTSLTRAITVSGLPTNLSNSLGLLSVNIDMGSPTGGRYDLNKYSVALTSPAGVTWTVMPTATIECTTLSGTPSYDAKHIDINYLSDNGALTYPNTLSCSQTSYPLGEPWSIGYYKIKTGQSFTTANGTNPNGTWTVTVTETANGAIGNTTGMQFNKVTLAFAPIPTVNNVSGQTGFDACSGAICLDQTNICTATNNGFSQNNWATDPSFYIISGCQWNGAMNNTAWFKFRPTATTMNITISGLVQNMQAIVVKPANTAAPCGTSGTQANAGNTADWIVPTGGSPCAMNALTANTLYTTSGVTGTYGNLAFNLSNLTPNDWYYLVVDGVGGNISPLYIEVAGTKNCACSMTAATTLNNNAGCSPLASGSATATEIGGTAPFSYAWTNGETTATATTLLAGTHTVTITDATSCTATASVTIAQLTAPTVSVSATNTNCGVSVGTATATPASGTPNYLWSTGATGATISNLPIGNYTVTATYAGNCTATATASVQLQGVPIIQTQTTPPRCGINNGSATASIIITIGVNYVWSNGQNGATIQNLAPGTYTVTASGVSLPCSVTASVTLAMTGVAPTVALTNQTNSTCQQADGSISVSTGNSSDGFVWSNGNLTANPQNLSAGVYQVTATNSSGCTATFSTTVTTTLIPNLSITQTPASCGNATGTATATITNGVTAIGYGWSTTPTQNTQTATALQGNTVYTVGVVSTDGCSNTASVTISGTPAISATMTPQTATCGQANGSITVTTAVAPTSVNWSGGNTSNPFLALAAGIYTATITDGNGCSTTQSTTIIGTAGLVLTNSNTPTTCNGTGGTATVNVVGNNNFLSYQWSNAATTQSVNNLTAGNYTVTVTQQFPTYTCTNSTTISITAPYQPQITVNTLSTTCGNANGNAQLTLTNPQVGIITNFLWSNGIMTPNLPAVASGTYTVTATSSAAQNCTTTTAVTIGNTGTTPLIALAPTQPTCGLTNGSVRASTTLANVSFVWSNTITDSTITALSAGVYTVTATNSGCSSTASITLSASTFPFTSTTTPTATRCAGTNGSVTTLPFSNANLLYTYLWSNAATTQTINNVAPGIYTVTITSTGGCTLTQSATVAPSLPDITASFAAIPVIYQGQQTTLTTLTNIPAVAYAWNNGATTNPISVSPTNNTTYTVTATSANGCTGSATISVIVNELKWNIPTVFTPNGDGENDTYYIVQYGGLTVKRFQVFNRWGELLHDKPNFPWDGKKGGEQQPIDTYIFKIEVVYPNDTTETRVGDFLLAR